MSLASVTSAQSHPEYGKFSNQYRDRPRRRLCTQTTRLEAEVLFVLLLALLLLFGDSRVASSPTSVTVFLERQSRCSCLLFPQ